MNLLFANDRRGAYPPSWYADTVTPLAPLAPLRGEERADVCVIGGGYTGLSAALHLARQGLDVRLLEAHRVGFGASGRNGGQVGSGQRVGQRKLERMVGRDDARRLWQVAEDAKALVRSLATGPIPEARWQDGIVEACWHDHEVREAHAEAEHLSRAYGYDRIRALDATGLRAIVGSPVYRGGTIDMGAGHIHPLAFALGLARLAAEAGATLHEMTTVHRIDGGGKYIVRADRGRVVADHVVMATNGYAPGLDRTLAQRVMPINNFIVATEPLGARAAQVLSEPVAVADTRFVVNYFRLSHDGRLLFGGGESYGDRFPKDIAAVVRRPMAEVFPDLRDVRIDYAWGGTLAITATRLPVFLRKAPGFWAAAGYSGHGVALATEAGRMVAAAIAGDADRFELMARLPHPRFPGGQLLRTPLLAVAMRWYALRDRLGI